MISLLLAQTEDKLGGKDLKGIGPLGNPTDIFTEFPRVISTIIGVLTVVAILWFIVMFILGAIKWISSGFFILFLLLIFIYMLCV